jgi:hypothetical protein
MALRDCNERKESPVRNIDASRQGSAAFVLTAFALVVAAVAVGVPVRAAPEDHWKALQAVARDIAKLKTDFPQLKDFSPTKNADVGRLALTYGYHTHQAQHPGGWTSEVPNPDDDGIWFYVDFHEPDSSAQIHTQPMVANLCLADKRVSFLILEGKNTKPVAGRIGKILTKYGVKQCDKPRPGLRG